MLANYFQQRGVGKSLFVIADKSGSVYAGENCCLAGGALRPARHAETCVRRDHHAVKDRGRFFILKNRKRRRTRQPIEWIVRASRTDAESVDEEKKYGHE